MPTPTKRWVTDHDERWSFILLYVGGAVALSVFANLFWVAALMVAHYLLEIWRHVILGEKHAFIKALWHVKLDIALILFALVIALYSDTVMAALGIGQAARAGQAAKGAQLITRFAIIERGLRIFFLTIDDITRIALILWKNVTHRKSDAATQADLQAAVSLLEEEENTLHAKESRLSKGDIFSLGFGTVCVILILLAPALTSRSAEATMIAIVSELSP